MEGTCGYRIRVSYFLLVTRQAVRASQQHGAKLRLRSDRSFASKIHESTRPQNRARELPMAPEEGDAWLVSGAATLKELISPCVRI